MGQNKPLIARCGGRLARNASQPQPAGLRLRGPLGFALIRGLAAPDGEVWAGASKALSPPDSDSEGPCAVRRGPAAPDGEVRRGQSEGGGVREAECRPLQPMLAQPALTARFAMVGGAPGPAGPACPLPEVHAPPPLTARAALGGWEAGSGGVRVCWGRGSGLWARGDWCCSSIPLYLSLPTVLPNKIRFQDASGPPLSALSLGHEDIVFYSSLGSV